MKFDITRFDEYRENNRLEAKKAKGGLPNSLWETYSSMANCYGGVILLGVAEKDDGSFETKGRRSVAPDRCRTSDVRRGVQNPLRIPRIFPRLPRGA